MSLGTLLFLIALAAVLVKFIFFDNNSSSHSGRTSKDSYKDSSYDYYCDDDCDH